MRSLPVAEYRPPLIVLIFVNAGKTAALQQPAGTAVISQC